MGLVLARLNPFASQERTSFERPKERMLAIREVANQSTGTDTADQRTVVDGLVQQLQGENDPMLREAMYQTIAKFKVPKAQQTVTAGLQDRDPYVRITCCQLLGEYSDPAATTELAQVLREEADFDVRVAAARALGSAQGGREVLVAALQDRDPAMQYVGAQAMKEISGQDFGGNVAAYVALAEGKRPEAPPEEPSVEVANRLPSWIPFF